MANLYPASGFDVCDVLTGWTQDKGNAGDTLEVSTNQNVVRGASTKSYHFLKIAASAKTRMSRSIGANTAADVYFSFKIFIPSRTLVGTEADNNYCWIGMVMTSADKRLTISATRWGRGWFLGLGNYGGANYNTQASIPCDRWVSIVCAIHGVNTAAAHFHAWVDGSACYFDGQPNGTSVTPNFDWSTSGFVNNLYVGMCQATANMEFEWYLDDLLMTDAPPCGALPANVWSTQVVRRAADTVRIGVACSTPSSVTLEYGTTTGYGSAARKVYQTADHLYTEFEITGLAVDTAYHYQVTLTNDTDATDVMKSGDRTFTIAGPTTATKVIVIGDLQRVKGESSTTNWTSRQASPHLCVLTGDIGLVDNLTQQDNTVASSFLRGMGTADPVLKKCLCLPCLGNHDATSDGGPPTQALTMIPVDSTNFSFDLGYATWICIDTNQTGQPSAATLAWLKAELRKSAQPWKIVVGHKHAFWGPDGGGAYALKVTNYDQAGGLHSVLKANGAHMYLCGHLHNYNRYCAEGILYVTAPYHDCEASGVAAFRNTGPAAAATKPKYGSRNYSLNVNGYLVINVGEKAIDIALRKDTDDSVADAFRLTQRAGTVVKRLART